jgi:hypothetical protein
VSSRAEHGTHHPLHISPPVPDAAARFEPRLIAGLDEPVRRYFAHAIADGASLAPWARLALSGHVRVGMWLRFRSVWEGDGSSFSWDATAGPGPLPLLHVHDRFADGVGSMAIRLRPPLRRLSELELLHAENADVARSGAGRAALEALWVPPALLPQRGVSWRAESDDLIVATWSVPPERPELRITIAPDGAVRSYRALRWRSAKHGYVPFGADVHAEGTFGAFTLPACLEAGWGHGSDAWSPFFRCDVTAHAPFG